jgi:hypothetical protein
VQFSRLLHNEAVTVGEMSASAAARTAERVAGKDILAIQDTSELVFGGKSARARGFGPVGHGGALGGLCLHSVLAVDALTGEVIGLVHMEVWNRDQGKVGARHKRATADKESQRWLTGTAQASVVLSQAARITAVSDRESDFYEGFTGRPENVHLITRAAQDRRIKTSTGDDGRLFAFADGLPEKERLKVTIPAAPGRPQRETELALRFAPVLLCKPKNSIARQLAKTIGVTLVDIRETTPPATGEPIHWRLLTTHAVDSVGAARMVLDFYRRRWIIEDYFRTLKTAGFDIEAATLEEPAATARLAGAAAVAAVTVMQLVRARDGSSQGLEAAFDPVDRPLLEALSATLEGKTARQKNPHPPDSLAFAAWVIARLGSWDGYYGKPGPKVMRRGLQDFYMIKYGYQLGPRDV